MPLRNPTPPPPLLLVGGLVLPDPPSAGATRRADAVPDAILLRDGRVAAVGDARSLRALAPPRTEIVDLHGAAVVPAPGDAHLHILGGGLELDGPQLREAATPEKFGRRLAAADQGLPAGEWIVGGSWDETCWPGQALPNRWLLDQYVPNRPVWVTRYDGHIGVANSRALAAAGIDRATASPSGGQIDRDPSAGEPTGVLRDAAMGRVEAAIPPLTPARIRRGLENALEAAARCGLAALHDMGLPCPLDLFLAVVRELHAEGQLTVRLDLCRPLSEAVLRPADADRPQEIPGWLRIRRAKAFVDGSLGARTAAFFEPYADAPETCGLLMEEPAALCERLELAARNGWQLSVHAIGDRANHLLLAALLPERGQTPRLERGQTSAAQRGHAQRGQTSAAEGTAEGTDPALQGQTPVPKGTDPGPEGTDLGPPGAGSRPRSFGDRPSEADHGDRPHGAAGRDRLDEEGGGPPRIEHAQHLRDADLLVFAASSAIASVQPYHAVDDARFAERRLGSKRLREMYRFRSLADAGVVLALGSDWPVAPLDPWEGITAAVQRELLSGAGSGTPWQPQEALTLELALAGYTTGVALAAGQVGWRGTLHEGQAADLTILAAPPAALLAERALLASAVRGTVVGGRWAWRHPSLG